MEVMTLNEAIKHAEEVAEENENVVNTGTFEDGWTVAEMYCDDTECINAHLSRCAKCAEEHRQLAEWLKDYKRLLEQEKWISVSERLPENHKDVLAYLSSDRISICCYNSHKLPFSNDPIGWCYLPGISFIDFKKEHVVAWMPLPGPYEAESEG